MTTATVHRDSIADVLLREGWIDKSQYQKAMEQYERTRDSLVRIFSEMGALNEETRLNILQRTMAIKVVSLQDVTPRSEVAGFVSREVCRRRHVVPLQLEEASVLVAMEDPTDVRTIADLEKIFSRSVKPVLASTKDILEAINRLPEPITPARTDMDGTGYKLVSTLSLLAITFVPIVAFYYAISNTKLGKDWYANFGTTTFENILVFVVVWGSWAAVAYFLNDLIFGKPAED